MFICASALVLSSTAIAQNESSALPQDGPHSPDGELVWQTQDAEEPSNDDAGAQKSGEQKPPGKESAAVDPEPSDTEPSPITESTGAAAGPVADRGDDDFMHFSITFNPLTLILGKFGANIEYLPTRHVGIMLNPSYLEQGEGSGFESPEQIEGNLKQYGAELGVRVYSGDSGASGFFAGASLVFIHTKHKQYEKFQYSLFELSKTLNSIGVAVDLGGQYISEGGITFGGGIGMMRLHASDDLEYVLFPTKGIYPRVLMTFGYSF
ncbi:MAG: hypothetical protein FWD57_15120 [Polyangiaceae bacterium]|nr:hypothetical protein [Polyangiaceae bacterium]